MSNTPDELGLKLFAAWCGTTSEHAATRTLWETQGAQYTVDGWNRVSKAAREFHNDQRALNSDLLAALKAWIKHRSAVFDAQMRGKLDEIPPGRIDEIVEQAEAAIKAAEKQSVGEQS